MSPPRATIAPSTILHAAGCSDPRLTQFALSSSALPLKSVITSLPLGALGSSRSPTARCRAPAAIAGTIPNTAPPAATAATHHQRARARLSPNVMNYLLSEFQVSGFKFHAGAAGLL